MKAPRRIRSLLREIVFVAVDRFAHWIDPNEEQKPKEARNDGTPPPSNGDETKGTGR